MKDSSEKSWLIAKTVFAFSAIYAAFHKLLIPLSLKAFPINQQDYSKLDLRVLPAIALLYLLRGKGALGPLTSLLAGVCVAYGIVETVAATMGKFSGWLSVSHLISSVPVGLSAIALLSVAGSFRPLKRYFSRAWLGALTVFFAFGLDLMGVLPSALSSKRPGQELSFNSSKKEEAPAEMLSDSQLPAAHCGAQAFLVSENELKVLPQINLLEVRECGFVPSAFELGSSLRVDNKSEKTFNLHVQAIYKKGPKRNLNQLLLPGKSFNLQKKLPTKGLEYLLVYSDNRPELGIALIIGSKEANLGVEVRRSPVGIESVSGGSSGL